jgi:SAM-dependent methyltransferase
MNRQTDDDWIRIGQDEPYHGVLSQERFLRRNLTPEILQEFWASGVEEMTYVKAVLERHFGPFRAARALDFGCGVGRLARALAGLAETVVGLDISPGMLTEARRGAPANVEFATELGERTFDWINSVIVLQHIPPVRGYVLFEDLLSRLEPAGVLSVQFTIFRDRNFLAPATSFIEEAVWDGETIRALRQTAPAVGTMLMYDYDLTRMVALCAHHGVAGLFLEHTNHGGCHGVRLFGRRAG